MPSLFFVFPAISQIKSSFFTNDGHRIDLRKSLPGRDCSTLLVLVTTLERFGTEHPLDISNNDPTRMSRATSLDRQHHSCCHTLGGTDIANLLASTGPIVKAVLLRCRHTNAKEEDDNMKPATESRPMDEKVGDETCNVCHVETALTAPLADVSSSASSLQEPRVLLTDLIEQIEIDTTPKKSMVAKTLGGPFTFLGQYEDEGIMLMIRNLPDDLEDVVQIEREEEDHEGNDTAESIKLFQELSRLYKTSQLKILCHQRDVDTEGMLEKADLVKALLDYQGQLPPYNPHHLQPPLHKTRVRGDILCLKVAQTAEELDVDDEHDEETENADDDQIAAKEIVVMPNEEFFLDYTRDEYIRFASRTDIPEYEPTDPEAASNDEDEGDDYDDDEDNDESVAFIPGEQGEELDEEDKTAMFNLVMNEVLRQYREDNGRGPNTRELLELRASIAKELDVKVAQVPDADWNEKAKNTPSPSSKKIAFQKEDKVKEFVPHEDEYNYDGEPGASAMDGVDDDDDDDGYSEPPSKKMKTADKEDDDGDDDSKPAAVVEEEGTTTLGVTRTSTTAP
jgi:hypothetical protein